MMAAVYLAACGAPSSISGSPMRSITRVAGPDAVEVADGATHPAAAPQVSHPTTPVGHHATQVPVTPVSRPPAPPPAADRDREPPGLNCQIFNAPGRPKVMCAPQ
jgi:hypothetical protein